MSSSAASFWRRMASGRENGVAGMLLRALLTLPALLYGAAQLVRAALYKAGLCATRRLPLPVISIGNITVGGTGKTPVTALVAGLLIARGLRVAVLSRGYGGSREGETTIVSDGAAILMGAAECGDEPYLLASTIPGLMVVMGSDRHTAGLLALQRLNPDVFLLDDGFQHLRLHRDLNILLLDHARPFGNGSCLPAGLLREPVSAARRADLVIHTRSPMHAEQRSLVPGRPYCGARHVLVDLLPLGGGEPLDFAALSGKRVLACAGIAEPDAFFDSLRQQGVQLAATLALSDHAVYDQSTSDLLTERFRACGADVLLTTGKDGVKMEQFQDVLAGRVFVCRLALELDDPAPLEEALRNLLQK